MTIPDVNVLLAAFFVDHIHHQSASAWLEVSSVRRDRLGLYLPVLGGFVRVATHPRAWTGRADHGQVFRFLDWLMEDAETLGSSPRVWPTFRRLVVETRATGNLVPDALYAAAALIENAKFATFGNLKSCMSSIWESERRISR